VQTFKAFKELGISGTVEAMGTLYADRYGSVDKALQTIESDPIGFLADLSFVLAGPAAVVQKVSKTGSVASKTAGKVSKAAAAVDPLNIAKAGVKQTAKSVIPKGAPAALYQKGAKLSPAGGTDVNKALTTATTKGFMPTYKGVGKLTQLQNAIGREIGDWVDAKSATGALIDPAELKAHINVVREKVGGVRLGSAENLRQVTDVLDELDDLVRTYGVDGKLTPAQVQNFKTTLYDRLYPTPTGAPGVGTKAAEQALARGAKESLEKVLPDIKALNKMWGDLQNLKRPLTSAAERIERRDILPLVSAMNIGSGHAIGGKLGATLGVAATILEMPRLKAYAAITLSKAQQANVFNNSIPWLYLTQGGLAKVGQITDEKEAKEYEEWLNNYDGITIPITKDRSQMQEQ